MPEHGHYIRLLGELRVDLPWGGSVRRFRSQKTAALLAYLAYHRHRVYSREHLADLFWPEDPPRAGRNSLRVALSSLRCQLDHPDGMKGDSILVCDGNGLGIDPARCHTDAAAFEDALRRAREADSGDARTRLRLLGEATALYRGELLPAFYEEWIVPERERLALACQEALGEQARLHAALGEAHSALECARRAVALDPLSADANCLLIEMQGRAGRKGDARRHFARWAQRLKRETGDEPGEEAEVLLQAVLAAPTGRTAGSGGTGEADTLPTALTRYFGRETEREQLALLLRAPESRLITITGEGGVGKTRLAVEAARRYREETDAPAYFVALAALSDARLLPRAIADALGLPPRRSLPGDDPLEPAVDFLSSASAPLLILDNFEQIAAGGAAAVQALVERIPELVCLVTSRRHLGLPGERLFPLSPLPVPSPPGTAGSTAVDVEGHFASVQLFADRARARRPDFRITAENAREVAALCALLEGIPLALEIAATRIAVLTPGQMLARFGERATLLGVAGEGADGLPSRHRSLRAAMDASYRLLPGDQQCFFASLSVFRGGWSGDAACHVSGREATDALDLLDRLRTHSLIAVDGRAAGPARFRMLETLRAFAAGCVPPEERAVLPGRHADYFLALAEAAHPHVGGGDPTGAWWRARLDEDRDNLRAALEWLRGISSSDGGEGYLRLAGALGGYWRVGGDWDEGREHLRAALAADAARDTGRGRSRLRALLAAAVLACEQDDFDDAGLLLGEARELADRLGDATALAHALRHLGYRAMSLMDLSEARALLERSRAIFRALGDRAGVAMTLHTLGSTAMRAWELDEAQSQYEESLAHRAEGDVGEGTATTHITLSTILSLRGESEAAVRSARRALELYEAAESPWGVATALRMLGALALWQDDDRGTAREYLEQAGSALRRVGDRRGYVHVLVALAETARRDRDLAEARGRLEAGLRVAAESGDRGTLAIVLEWLAHVEAEGEEFARAARLFGAADGLRQKLGVPLPPRLRDRHPHWAGATRSALGAEATRAAWAAGAALPLAEAAALAPDDAEAGSP